MSRKITILPGDIILSQKILEELPKKEGSKIRRFRCECLDCGNISDKFYTCLSKAKTGCMCTSSGWIIRKNPKRNPEEKKAYSLWHSMKQRCYNEKHTQFKYWGGKGITVCEEWKNSFDAFYRDMYPRPEGMSIDRIDGTKGYSKENCRWATIEEQNNNRSTCIMIGDITLSQWATSAGIDRENNFGRICIYYYYSIGYSLEDIRQKYDKYLLKKKNKKDLIL